MRSSVGSIERTKQILLTFVLVVLLTFVTAAQGEIPNWFDLSCLHEAGHTVIALANGIPVDWLKVYPPPEAGGVTQLGWRTQPLSASDHVKVDLGGFEAVKLFMHYTDWHGPGSDFKHAKTLMPFSQIWNYEEETAQILLKHKDAVLKITAELRANGGYLSGKRATALFNGAEIANWPDGRQQLPPSIDQTPTSDGWERSVPPQAVLDGNRSFWEIHRYYAKLIGCLLLFGLVCALFFHMGVERENEHGKWGERQTAQTGHVMDAALSSAGFAVGTLLSGLKPGDLTLKNGRPDEPTFRDSMPAEKRALIACCGQAALNLFRREGRWEGTDSYRTAAAAIGAGQIGATVTRAEQLLSEHGQAMVAIARELSADNKLSGRRVRELFDHHSRTVHALERAA